MPAKVPPRVSAESGMPSPSASTAPGSTSFGPPGVENGTWRQSAAVRVTAWFGRLASATLWTGVPTGNAGALRPVHHPVVVGRISLDPKRTKSTVALALTSSTNPEPSQ